MDIERCDRFNLFVMFLVLAVWNMLFSFSADILKAANTTCTQAVADDDGGQVQDEEMLDVMDPGNVEIGLEGKDTLCLCTIYYGQFTFAHCKSKYIVIYLNLQSIGL